MNVCRLKGPDLFERFLLHFPDRCKRLERRDHKSVYAWVASEGGESAEHSARVEYLDPYSSNYLVFIPVLNDACRDLSYQSRVLLFVHLAVNYFKAETVVVPATHRNPGGHWSVRQIQYLVQSAAININCS